MNVDGGQLFIADDKVITVIPNPKANGGNRVLKLITFFNPDSATILITVQKRKGTNIFRVWSFSLAQNESTAYDDPVVLTDTDEDLQVILDTDPTNAMELTSTWGDF